MIPKSSAITAFCVSVFIGLSALTAQVVATEIAINPQATFLRINRDSSPLSPAIIGLTQLEISAGDRLRLQQLGDFDCGAPCVDDRTAMIGVFSSSTALLSTDQLHRVPDAIDAGQDIVTSPTYFDDLPTDIPEDFAITDTTIIAPLGAAYLFVAAHDSLYSDNTDPDGDFAIRITRLVGLPGDYNDNGVVDAADCTVWRDTLGSTTDLRANGDDTGASAGVIDGADYLAWKSHFGMTAGGGSGAVPEPATFPLLIVGLWSLALHAKRSKRVLD